MISECVQGKQTLPRGHRKLRADTEDFVPARIARPGSIQVIAMKRKSFCSQSSEPQPSTLAVRVLNC